MNPTALVVTSVHPADDPRIRYKSIEALIEDGWDVTYVCRAPGPTHRDGLRVRLLEGSRVARSLRAIWIMLRVRRDLTIIHDPELLPGALVVAMFRGRTSVVFDVHENLPAQLRTREGMPAPVRRLMSLLAAVSLRVAERAMTITLAEPGYGGLFRSRHPIFENLPVSGALPMRSPGASGVVYVGDITRQRGAALLVEAVGRLDDVPLTLIGRCRPDFAEELASMAERLGIDLSMPGYLPYDEAWELASRSLVGVSPLLDLPNYRNSLPTKIYEYRSVGLVAVASDLSGSLRAVEGSTVVRTFTAGSVAELAGVLFEVLSDELLQRRAVEEAKTVRASSSWDAEAFAGFYRSLLTSIR